MKSYDEWKLAEPQEFREYEETEPACECGNPAEWHGDKHGRRVYCCAPCWEREEDYQSYQERHYEEKHGERLPCGCIGSCDPYAHDTAPDWDGRHDAIYPQRVSYEPYIIDEEFSGWVLYDENDREGDRPLRKFSTLQEAKDWIDLEAEGPQ